MQTTCAKIFDAQRHAYTYRPSCTDCRMMLEAEWRDLFDGSSIEVLLARIACAAEVKPYLLLHKKLAVVLV